MFDTLVDSRLVAPVRTLASGGSLLLHAAILLSLSVASYLHVEPMAGQAPRMDPRALVLLVQWQPALAPPPPPAGSSGANATSSSPSESATHPIPNVVQPRQVPSEVPQTPMTGGAGGSLGGVEGGMEGGVPGGTVGGSHGGVVGGVPSGVPGGALDGLPRQDDPVYLVGEIRPPVRTSYVKPEYPELARKARAEGSVILEVVVGRKGEVESIKVLRSDPLFEDAAIEAVRQWRYQPALQGGRPVKVYLTVKVEFGLT